jgi:type IV pilus assembly protein PilM
MAANPGVWGIDIGQSALKAIRLENIDGVLTATAFDYIEHPKILSQPDADADQLIKDALAQFLSRNTIKGDKVSISVPGQSGLARFVKLPPVEEKKISDIVKFEAKQQIPFPLDEVVWDFQKIGQGVVTDGFAIDTEIGLFAMKRDMINRYLAHFGGVNVEVHFVQMTPLALCNYVTYELLKIGGPGGDEEPKIVGGKKQCAVALDIGTDSSNLIITDGARIIWQRPIPLGGNHFTRAMTKEMKLTFAKAEHLKRNAAKATELPQILKALKPVLTDFVGEVQRSLGYFTNTHRDAAIAYMVGLGSAFRLPGLQKFLAEKLQLDIRKPAKLDRLSGETITTNEVFKENLLTFPVAYGLALQGIGNARLATNLLPPEITFDRKIRAKKPWAVAAAAMILLGGGILAFLLSLPYASVNAQVVQDQMKKDEQAISQAKSVKQKIESAKAEVQKTKDEVKALIAGQDERKNWIKLNEFVNFCLPVPGEAKDGGNLLDADQTVLWSTPQGLEAIRKYQNRLARGLDPKVGWDDETRSALPVVEIDGVYARYTDNLKAFLEKAKLDSKQITGLELDGMLDEDRKNFPTEEKPEENKGWIVEIRGTTSYSQRIRYESGREDTVQGQQFVHRTLLRNLQREAKKVPAAPKDAEGNPDPKKAEEILDPVRGRVSHIFLWYAFPDLDPKLNKYLYLDNAPLADALMPAAAGSSSSSTDGAGGPMGVTGGKTGGPGSIGSGDGGTGSGTSTTPTIGSWTPLLASGGNRSGSSLGGEGPSVGGPGGIGAGGGTSGGGGSNPYAPKGSSSSTSGPSGMGGPNIGGPSTDGGGGIGGVQPKTTTTSKVKPRYEFIILMVWKEPTPSDKFVEKTE